MSAPTQNLDRIAALFDHLGLKYELDDRHNLFVQINEAVLSFAALGESGEMLSIIAKPSVPLPNMDRPALLEACNARNRDFPFPKAYVIEGEGGCEVRTNISHLLAPDTPASQLQSIVRMSIETNLSFFAGLTER